jgi:hypothetical protein
VHIDDHAEVGGGEKALAGGAAAVDAEPPEALHDWPVPI